MVQFKQRDICHLMLVCMLIPWPCTYHSTALRSVYWRRHGCCDSTPPPPPSSLNFVFVHWPHYITSRFVCHRRHEHCDPSPPSHKFIRFWHCALTPRPHSTTLRFMCHRRHEHCDLLPYTPIPKTSLVCALTPDPTALPWGLRAFPRTLHTKPHNFIWVCALMPLWPHSTALPWGLCATEGMNIGSPPPHTHRHPPPHTTITSFGFVHWSQDLMALHYCDVCVPHCDPSPPQHTPPHNFILGLCTDPWTSWHCITLRSVCHRRYELCDPPPSPPNFIWLMHWPQDPMALHYLELEVWIPAGVAGEFSSPGSTFCADSYFGIRFTPVLPQ